METEPDWRSTRPSIASALGAGAAKATLERIAATAVLVNFILKMCGLLLQWSVMDGYGRYEVDAEDRILLGNSHLLIYHIEHAMSFQVAQVTVVAREVTRCNLRNAR